VDLKSAELAGLMNRPMPEAHNAAQQEADRDMERFLNHMKEDPTDDSWARNEDIIAQQDSRDEKKIESEVKRDFSSEDSGSGGDSDDSGNGDSDDSGKGGKGDKSDKAKELNAEDKAGLIPGLVSPAQARAEIAAKVNSKNNGKPQTDKGKNNENKQENGNKNQPEKAKQNQDQKKNDNGIAKGGEMKWGNEVPNGYVFGTKVVGSVLQPYNGPAFSITASEACFYVMKSFFFFFFL
jgi:hypothetical protein